MTLFYSFLGVCLGWCIHWYVSELKEEIRRQEERERYFEMAVYGKDKES